MLDRIIAASRPTRFTAHLEEDSSRCSRTLGSSYRVRLSILLLVALMLGTSGHAALPGRVEGTVVDPAGAKISGARVLLRRGAGVIAYTSSSDDEGRFVFAGVEAGSYSLVVEAVGFSQTHEVKVDASGGKTETLMVRLDIAAVSDHIVVSATRTPTSASESGGAISIIGREDFLRSNQSVLSESLRSVPGFSVAQTGGRGGLTSIFVRGGESDYNKVLVDGVAVNEAGGLFDFAALTPENLDRVEVVRGPRSALFGSDAMTSVIQLMTRRGSTAVPEFEFSAEGGSFNHHRETAQLSGLARWFDYSGSFGFQTSGGRFENNDYINRTASANLGFQLSPRSSLRITSRWGNDTVGVPGPASALFVDPDQRQNRHALSSAAAFENQTTSRWQQSARFIYSEFSRHSFDPVAQDLTKPDRPPLPPFSFFPDSAFDFREHQKRAGVHYQSIATLANSNILTAGIDFEHESAVFDDEFSGRVSPKRNNLGMYVQGQAAWRERVFLTAGVRVERNTARVPADLKAALTTLGSTTPAGEVGFGVSANPSVAVSFLARRHKEGLAIGATRLKASFGTGIKEPEMHEAFSPNTFFLGNPNLKPERARSFDAGVVQEFLNRRASIDLTYFENRFRDLIVFQFDPLTFGPIKLPGGVLTNFINFDRASARGIELTGSARPMRQLRVTPTYTFLRSRLDRAFDGTNREVGLSLLRRPRHSGSLEVAWVEVRYDLILDGLFVGERRDIDPVTGARFDLAGRPIVNDGYAKLNAAGAVHLTHFLSMFARVENLLNRNYEEVRGFPAYRLNFSAGLRIRIGGGR